MKEMLEAKTERPLSARRSIQVLRSNRVAISQGKRKRDEVAVVAEQQTGVIQQQLQEERFWQGRAECRKRCRRDEESDDCITMGSNVGKTLLTGCHSIEEEHEEEFMKIPTPLELRQIQEEYLQQTSQEALDEGVCGVCARETPRGDLTLHGLQELPNYGLLTPKISHHAHWLYDGALLERKGVNLQQGRTLVSICSQCFVHLKHNRRPRFGLCNGLWIGNVPVEMQDLTIPEELLVALTFPRCFVFKMHPKIGRVNDPSSLQRGMVGNVTSFPLNVKDVVEMIDGRKLPQPMEILPALIAVTFVGAKQFCKKWLSGILRVRRARVAAALRWLIKNNPLYAKFQLDEVRLGKMPEDGVPIEILAVVRQETDAAVLVEEGESYVPGDLELGDKEASGDFSELSLEDLPTESELGSVLLAHLGTTADSLETETDTNALVSAVSNLVQEGTYEVRFGRKFVQDFPNRNREGEELSNYSASAFPTLFPYGVGGVESQREISFIEHIRYCLLFHDRRFRKHQSFPFVMFGIYQKRQALSSARLQVCRRDFEHDMIDILQVSREDLQATAREQEQSIPISNSKVKKLFSNVKLTAGRIIGTDQSRASLRSKIWSIALFMGPPSIWMTINLADIHDPIAQFFCGEDINLDQFNDLQGRCANNIIRAQNIAQDPYAGAKYFHTMILIILETLFGVRSTRKKTYSKQGLLGRVSAFAGAVESQNRASLHLHVLLWLVGAPRAAELKQKFQSEDFRETVRRFIAANIHASVPGLTQASLPAIPRESDISCSRPLHPSCVDFAQKVPDRLLRLVRNLQVHVCVKGACKHFDLATRAWTCKRRAPWPESETVVVNPDGTWFPVRHFGMVNNFHPQLLLLVQCNGDIKLLTNGSETKNITWYIAKYATKAQKRLSNVSALLAKSLAFHFEDATHLDDVRARSRLLLFRCFQGLNRQQEQSAPQVISYLMGWDDSVLSHEFVPFYLSSLQAYLHRHFQEALPTNELVSVRTSAQTCESSVSISNCETDLLQQARTDEASSFAVEERMMLTLNKDGILSTRSQLADYLFRGNELNDLCYVRFVCDTYEEIVKGDAGSLSCDGELRHEGDDASRHEIHGRKPHIRSAYLAAHPQCNRIRVLRASHHNTLPNFVGPWLPRSDDPETFQYYSCVMLALLKPWRTLQDLIDGASTWSVAFQDFLQQPASQFARRFTENAQFYHECKDSSNASSGETLNTRLERNGYASASERSDSDSERGAGMEGEESENDANAQDPEHDLETYLFAQANSKESRHGDRAVNIAIEAGMFTKGGTDWSVEEVETLTATEVQFHTFENWQKRLASGVETAPLDSGEFITEQAGSVRAHAETVAHEQQTNGSGNVTYVPAVEPLAPLKEQELNEEQRRAFNIVMEHVKAEEGSEDTSQLLMQIIGEAGTGKSRVIQTITEAFETAGFESKLRKGAFTGIAACLIGGQTLHSLFGLNLQGNLPSEDRVRKLAESWKSVRYLIIDEYSMISRELLARLSKILNIVFKHLMGEDFDLPFGGVNVILCGDFHQFPPVKGAKRCSLYFPTSQQDTVERNAGSELYQQFSTVVILKCQLRVQDAEWQGILQRARHGKCIRADLELLRRSQLDESASTNAKELAEDPWTEAVLVTPRNAVRKKWNTAASHGHCQKTKRQLLICPAEDTKRGSAVLSSEERLALLKRKFEAKSRQSDRSQLEDEILLAEGMKVMLVTNIQTDFDMANGSRGVVQSIFLDPREPQWDTKRSERTLHFPPACVLIKLERMRVGHFEELSERVVPIFPVESKIRLQLTRKKTVTVTRRQIPLTPAYAFTDYRAQGQSLPYVIVDLGRPPTGKLTAFNAYVALSRSAGRKTIKLLREFDEELFTTVPCEELEEEDIRLEALDRKTAQECWS
ncbi:hypothetical protein M378DRAFT_1051766 [Amanita muscaria Koide BX008]|uniref:ATP-dependent DNA helicase n=1 Tax=Amanita muscaria (strain Koide BX008) TaxID=946122 RepID=A0A0C2RWS7_AMAMK|nr:hypothetical protein M378DRAFT_1051766 [Amanita muscaria Koide BX008]